MSRQSIFAFVSLALASSPAFAANWVELPFTAEASQVFVSIFAPSPVPGLSVEGFTNGEIVSQALCVAKVLRPARLEAGLRHADNSIRCAFRQADGHPPGRLVASLAEFTIESWGNRFDPPRPFEFHQAAAGEAYFDTLKRWHREDPKNPMGGNLNLCGPDGLCNEQYILNQHPDDPERNYISPLQLTCHRTIRAEDGSVAYPVKCAFMD